MMSKIKTNKKGGVESSIIGFAALLAILLTTAIAALILFSFNQGIQESDLIPEDAKEASDFANSRFIPILNYAFLFSFIAFFIVTIVTSVLINKINPIFWVVGLVLSLASTIFFSVMKLIYGNLRDVAILGQFIQNIPGAFMIMNNVEIIGTVWIFTQFTLMYKFREA